MSLSDYRVRRATIDDLPALRGLWQAMRLDPDELEHRLTEFQVAETSAGELCGGIALDVSGRHGRLQSEAFDNFALAEQLRHLLWPRIQLLASNHGVARLWTLETAPFWKQLGFQEPDDNALKKMPAEWGGDLSPWLTLQLHDEEALEKALSAEFARFKAQEAERIAKTLQRGRMLKSVATVLAIMLALFVIFFSLRLVQIHLENVHH